MSPLDPARITGNVLENQEDGRLSADADTALSSASPMEPASGLHPDGLQSAGAARLKVWWVPQIPMEAFEVEVSSLADADLLLDVLADYDAFQFEHRVKGDYCNAGGLVMLEAGEWVDWYDDALNCDFDEWREAHGRRAASGIEAATADETALAGSAEGKSPVAKPDAQEVQP
jgi:hypothetical protein